MSLLVWVMSRRAGRAWPVQSWSERCPWPCGWVVHSHRQGALRPWRGRREPAGGCARVAGLGGVRDRLGRMGNAGISG